MTMRLGIVVIDDRCAPHAVGLLKAAAARNWDTRCFLTDRGVFLLKDPEFRQLLDAGTTHFSLCELSIERYGGDGVSVEGLEDRIVIGGQYQNAELVHNSDQVLVF
jgi:predicted peroxiredoxin